MPGPGKAKVTHGDRTGSARHMQTIAYSRPMQYATLYVHVRKAGLGGDHEVTLHGGDPRCGCRGRPRGVGFLQGMDVSVEFRGVVGHFHPDMARVHLGLAPEGVLDRFLDPLRLYRRGHGDGVRHADHAPDLADHPLDFAALEGELNFALEGDPAALHPGTDAAFGDLDVIFQVVGDRRGDVGVVARRAGEPDLQVVGYGLDPVDPFRGPGRCQFLDVGGRVPGQGHGPVL